MGVACDRLVKPDGTVQLPVALAGAVVIIVTPEDLPSGGA